MKFLFKLIVNYFEAKSTATLFNHKVKRFKHRFLSEDYQIYIDVFINIPRNKKLTKSQIVEFYKNGFNNWVIFGGSSVPPTPSGYTTLILESCKNGNTSEKELKSIIGRMALSDFDLSGIQTKVNKIEFKLKDQIRDDKLNKLFATK